MPRSHRRARRPSNGDRPDRVSPHTRFSRRITALTVFFVLVCLVYAGLLITTQARGNAYSIYVEGVDIPTGGTTETVTVAASRGGIYDRNGKPLVTNRYAYDIEISHGSFLRSGSQNDRNLLLLSLVDRLKDSGASMPYQQDFPLSGTYPHMGASTELRNADSSTAIRYARVLARVELESDTTPDELLAYYMETYALAAHTDGIPLYTDEQIDTLLRIYYDMDARDFGAVAPYTLAADVPASYVGSQMEQSLSCVRISTRTERVYHYPGYAAHLLGRVGPIYAEDWSYYSAMGYPMNAIVGVDGCESAFESILHGTDGKMRVTLDAAGNVIAKETLSEPIPGQDIRLTIDIDMQIAAEDAMRQTGRQGAVVAMRADTGEYYALASAPTYEAGQFTARYEQLSSDPTQPLLNRATYGTYAPGSLYTLVTAAAGLGTDTISPSTLWTDSGRLVVGDLTLNCPHTHGTLGVGTALSDGCPVFFGQLGLRVGSSRLEAWEEYLGLGKSVGIETSSSVGTPSGVHPATEQQLASAACGQNAAQATPAQLCSMLATLITGGTRPSGHLLSEVRDYRSGELIYRTQTEVLSSTALDATERDCILRALRSNVQNDESYRALAEGLCAIDTDTGLLASTDERRALMLSYGQKAFGSTAGSLSVCVALDEGTEREAANVTFAVLDVWQ